MVALLSSSQSCFSPLWSRTLPHLLRSVAEPTDEPSPLLSSSLLSSSALLFLCILFPYLFCDFFFHLIFPWFTLPFPAGAPAGSKFACVGVCACMCVCLEFSAWKQWHYTHFVPQRAMNSASTRETYSR